MSTVRYQDAYIVNVRMTCISGRTTITEEDLGLEKGTLPPHEVASLGSLVTIPREEIKAFNTKRAEVNRLLGRTGVRCSFGSFTPKSELDELVRQLEQCKKDWEDLRSNFLARLPTLINDRVTEFPKYSQLLASRAPSLKYVEKQIDFEIDVFKVGYADGDPYEDLLTRTLSRPVNDISRTLLEETSAFCQGIFERSLKDSGGVVKRNLTPLKTTLLPKLRSFQVLDGRLHALSKLLHDLLVWSDATLDAIPKGDPRILIDKEFSRFCETFDVLRSVEKMEKLLSAEHRRNQLTVVPTPSRVKPESPAQLPQAPSAVPASLPRAPKAPKPLSWG